MSSVTLPIKLPDLPVALVADVARFEGQRVQIRGWLYNRRSKGKLHFLQVRDGSGVIQAVMFKGDVDEATFVAADHLTQETSILVSGTVRKDERSAIGFELACDGLVVVAAAQPDYPISPKEHGVAFLMDHRHLWLRSRRQAAILRVRARIIKSIRDFLDGQGYLLVDTPIFTPAACEGTSTLFETDYHGQKAYLSQSGQLYNEATAAALGRVYTFGPTFRAEKSKTRRHLTEFWMVEPEAAYLDLDGVMDLAESMVWGIVQDVLRDCATELDTIDSIRSEAEEDRQLKPRREALASLQRPFVRLHHADAVKQLRALGSDISDGDDLGGDDETILTQQYDRPIFVTKYPAEVKAFYMKRDPLDILRTLSCDLLAPEGYGEIIGGGQREDDHDTLLAAIHKHQLPESAFDWYLDLRKYGSVPHGGFGLGVERTVAWICGLPHVRETIPFARLMDRLKP
ncbi:MAG: asparagine--tRNA ligase [Deltaproteobacteria bacterium]|nr:asparagine--tRNA ligase [Deltaproteobacteria bacterium]